MKFFAISAFLTGRKVYKYLSAKKYALQMCSLLIVGLGVFFFPAVTQATSYVCPALPDRPFFQVEDVECTAGPCNQLAVFGVYHHDTFDEPSKMIPPQKIFSPSTACALSYEYTIEIDQRPDGTLDFNVREQVNGLFTDLLSIAINGVLQDYPYRISYDPLAVYEIRSQDAIIRILPQMSDDKISGVQFSCTSGCTELTIKPNTQLNTYLVSYSEHAEADACTVVTARTQHDTCYDLSYYLTVEAVLSTGEHLGFSQGNEELLVSKNGSVSSPRLDHTSVDVGPYTLIIGTKNQLIGPAPWKAVAIGIIIALSAMIVAVIAYKKNR